MNGYDLVRSQPSHDEMASKVKDFFDNGGTIGGPARTMSSHTIASTSATRGRFPMVNFDIIGTGGVGVFSNSYKQLEFRVDGKQDGDMAKIIVGDMDLGIFLKEPSGYTKLPNGFILQWGRYGGAFNGGKFSAVLKYPIAFNTTRPVTFCDVLSAGGYYEGEVVFHSTYPNETQFTLVGNCLNSTGNYAFEISWFAIGY